MQCPNPACHHENTEGGNFCEQCGTPLAASNMTLPKESNQVLESTKKISKLYFQYFFEVLKKPYAASVNVGKEHFINAIITIILYSIMIPLMLYFGISSAINEATGMAGSLFGGDAGSFHPSFATFVLQPTVAYVIFLFLIATFVFVSIRLGQVNATYQEVISRFGSFLIPFTAILFIALILSLLHTEYFIIFLVLGYIGSIFIVPPFVISSFKKDSKNGLDTLYGTLVTYILTAVAILIMGNILFESLKESIGPMFNGLLGL